MAKPWIATQNARSNIDYIKETISINGEQYRLDDLRDYLCAEWNVLTHAHFIKWMVIKGELSAQYDWLSIFADVTNCFYPLHCFAQSAQPICQ